MSGPDIVVNGRRYREFNGWYASYGQFGEGGYENHPQLYPDGDGSGNGDPFQYDSEDRNFLSPSSSINLSKTSGFYMNIGGHRILVVIDRTTVPYGSSEWVLATQAISQLVSSYNSLTGQGQNALAHLDTIVFTASPIRSFADVGPNRYFYDTSEFYNTAGTLISPNFAASAIVHDANHILQYDSHLAYQGISAEVAGYQLQVDNGSALGLQPYEVNYLNGLISDPHSQDARLNQPPY